MGGVASSAGGGYLRRRSANKEDHGLTQHYVAVRAVAVPMAFAECTCAHSGSQRQAAPPGGGGDPVGVADAAVPFRGDHGHVGLSYMRWSTTTTRRVILPPRTDTIPCWPIAVRPSLLVRVTMEARRHPVEEGSWLSRSGG
jgi:hypothetical protein